MFGGWNIGAALGFFGMGGGGMVGGCTQDMVASNCLTNLSSLSAGATVGCPQIDCFGYGTTWKLSSTGTDYMLLVGSSTSSEQNPDWNGNNTDSPGYNADDPNSLGTLIDKSTSWADLGPVPDYWNVPTVSLSVLNSPSASVTTPVRPKMPSTFLGKYSSQVGCQWLASVDQGEGIVGSGVAAIAWASRGNYVVAGTFGVAYLAQLVNIREQCVNTFWGPTYY